MSTLPSAAIDQLHRGLAAMDLADAELSEALLRYLALLVQWNRAYNLTAVREPGQMVAKHLLDSLAIVPQVSACVEQVPAGQHGARPLRVVDIGTGAGLPGIPLALALPGIEVTLVETVGKKARFLREAVRALGLGARVRVLESRGEQVDEPGAHDCLVARALGTLAMLLATGGHLLRRGGCLLAMKGQVPAGEIALLPEGWQLESVLALAVPGLAAERHLVVVRKA